MRDTIYKAMAELVSRHTSPLFSVKADHVLISSVRIVDQEVIVKNPDPDAEEVAAEAQELLNTLNESIDSDGSSLLLNDLICFF